MVHVRGEGAYPTPQTPYLLGSVSLPEHWPCPVGELLHPPHAHGGAELGIVSRGRIDFYFDHHRYTLAEGDCVFIDGMTPHAMGRQVLQGSTYDYLHVSFQALLSVPPPDVGLSLMRACRRARGTPLQVFHAKSGTIASMQEAVGLYALGTPNSQLMAWGVILQLLANLLPMVHTEDPPLAGVPTSAPFALIEAVTLIHAKYAEPLTVAEIAKHCRVSVSQLAHVFSHAMNHSPIEYRNQIRVDKAKDRLIGSSDKISAISAEVGFENPTQFYRLFQRITGVTPAEFRKLRVGPL